MGSSQLAIGPRHEFTLSPFAELNWANVGLVFALFLVLIVWGLWDGELYAKEVAIYVAIFLVCATGFVLSLSHWTGGVYVSVAPIVLLTIYLLYRLVGNPSVT
jgi:hypothetical protein